MRPLHIVWQPLVNPAGQTCTRCDCRTIEVGADVFETVPEELILRAALAAAAQALSP